MAIVVTEGFRSSTGGNELQEVRRPWAIQGAVDEIDARAHLLGVAPVSYMGLPRDDKTIKVEEVGYRFFQCEVTYKTPPPGEQVGKVENGGSDPDDIGLVASFTTIGATAQITQCIEQIDYGPTARPDIRASRVINIDGDNVNPLDIVVPKMEITRRIRKAAITNFYLDLVSEATGTINSQPIFGKQVGEVLFTGASGQVNAGTWEIDLNFAYDKNQQQIIISDNVTVRDKRGWDYVWTMYKKDIKDNKFVPVPDTAFVSKIYREFDHKQLFF